MYKVFTGGAGAPITELGVIYDNSKIEDLGLDWVYIIPDSTIYCDGVEVPYPCTVDTRIVFHHDFLPAFTKGDEVDEWYKMGKWHRYNGPARSYYYIYDFSWSINGIEINPEKYFSWLDENGIDINNISDTDKFLISLYWENNG